MDSSDGQGVRGDRLQCKRSEFEPHTNAGFPCSARYDAITGPTEFIISINSVNMVNMP